MFILIMTLFSVTALFSGCGGGTGTESGTVSQTDSQTVTDTEAYDPSAHPKVMLGQTHITEYSILVPEVMSNILQTSVSSLNEAIKDTVGKALQTVTEPTGKDIVINCGFGFDAKRARIYFDNDDLILEAGCDAGVKKIFDLLIPMIMPDTTIEKDYRKTMSVTVYANIIGNTYDDKGVEKSALDFKVGQTAKIRAELLLNGSPISCDTFSYYILGDGIKTQNGKLPGNSEYIELDVKLDSPGFAYVYVEALDKNGRAISDYTPFAGGVGFSVTEIEQTYKQPDDFDKVWAELVGRLDKISTKPTVMKQFASGEKNPNGGSYPQYDDKNYVAYDIVIPCIKGINPVTAILTMPKDKVGVSGSLDISMEFHGYGVVTATPVCKPNTATLYVGIHGLENGREEAYYKNYADSNPRWGMDDADKTKIEDYYFYSVMLRDIQAARYLFTLPEYNGSGLTVSGGSMGAMQSVTVASVIDRGYIDGKVKKVDISVPWASDMGELVSSGAVHLVDYNIDGVDSHRIPRTWGIDYKEGSLYSYFDIANHIKGVKAPIDITASLGDYTSPPRSVAVLYNNAESSSSVKLTMRQNADHHTAGAGSKNFTMSK